jgi:hypothetical protein
MENIARAVLSSHQSELCQIAVNVHLAPFDDGPVSGRLGSDGSSVHKGRRAVGREYLESSSSVFFVVLQGRCHKEPLEHIGRFVLEDAGQMALGIFDDLAAG